ncbi:hypothetical protein [Paenibacillus apiarius]|uniref:hypothetical protein n=1 Tax=Paenibacillus apiarius TaxID=46240 RepID=UPI001F0916AB|nr:hypothetical protein [Paenibacillus apiarius]
MKKTPMFLLSALLSASFVLGDVALAAAADVSQTRPAPYAPLVMQSGNVDVESSQITRLSRDEFYARYAELTGKSISQVKSELANSEQKSPQMLGDQYYQTFDAEYTSNIDLGGGVKVRAGILVQVEEFMFGHCH